MNRRQTIVLITIGLVAGLLAVPMMFSNGRPVVNSMSGDALKIDVPQSIAERVLEDAVETTGNQEGLPYWAIQPAHTEVYLSGYVLSDVFQEPRIYLYPVESLTEANPAAGEQVETLRALLADPTAVEHDGALPMLPLMNASQMMQAQVQWLDFGNGAGIRYLTQVGQEAAQINNKDLFYTFQGFTDDGSIYVAAILPVTNAMLDAAAAPVDANADNSAHITNTTIALDQATVDSFAPSLDQLDAMIASIEVH